MIQRIFAIYDSKARSFLQPFYAPEIAVAQRHFRTAANDAATQICQYPEDFTLFYIGEYDDQSGVITPLDKMENLGLANAFKKE